MIKKVKKLVANLHDKTEYVMHIGNLTQALNNGLVLKKVYRVNNQSAWLKPLDKIFLSWWIMQSLKKLWEMWDIKTVKRRNYLVSEPTYYVTKIFTEYLLPIEMEKMQIFMNKPVYLGLSILELNKMSIYEFWHDYVKPKYREKTKLCSMDTESIIVYIKTNDIYKDIAEDIETRFDISNYELGHHYLKEKIKKQLD